MWMDTYTHETLIFRQIIDARAFAGHHDPGATRASDRWGSALPAAAVSGGTSLRVTTLIAALVTAGLSAVTPVNADEIRILSAAAIQSAFSDIARSF